MNSMKRKWGVISFTLLLTIVLLNSTVVKSASSYEVTSSDDSGAGTLREALSSGATVISIHESVSIININDTLKYQSTDPLTIIGSGQTVDGNELEDTLLEITNGADLTISNLDFTVNGGYNVLTKQGGGKGIFVNVPANRVGIVNLWLTNVVVSNVGLHGIHVLDCDAVDCGAGSGGEGNGSQASIHVNLRNVTVDNVGNGGFDSDGVRIDDRGKGDIIFNAVGSTFNNIGADGIELDEGGNGDVVVNVRNSVFEFNGAYCDGIDPKAENPADPTCVEDDDGELVLDLDDGFDIDEAGEGSVTGQIKNILISHNLDEGIDIDEEGEGGINIDLVRVEASDNVDEGIKLSEEGNGDVVAHLRRVTTVNNGDDGIQIEQDHEGDIIVTVNSTTSMDNMKKGLKVSQDGSGGGSLKVRGPNIDSIKTNLDEI